MTPGFTPPPVLHILGVPVHDLTYADTLTAIAALIASREPHQLCTVNPEFVMAAQRDAEFRAILSRATLNLPDGVGLLWAARLRGHRLRQRVAGSTLVAMLAEQAAQHGWRLYFLGAGPGVAALAAEKLTAQYPGLTVITDPADPTPTEAPAILARIHAARPDVLLVAYGAPKQDKWIAAYGPQASVPVMMGVGGSFDFIAGTAQRAPRWLQRLGLEWLHRLWNEPWRWRRMLALPQFAIAVLTRRQSVTHLD